LICGCFTLSCFKDNENRGGGSYSDRSGSYCEGKLPLSFADLSEGFLLPLGLGSSDELLLGRPHRAILPQLGSGLGRLG